MKKLLALILLWPLSLLAVSPSYTSFDWTQFVTNGPSTPISIKNLASITNPVVENGATISTPNNASVNFTDGNGHIYAQVKTNGFYGSGLGLTNLSQLVVPTQINLTSGFKLPNPVITNTVAVGYPTNWAFADPGVTQWTNGVFYGSANGYFGTCDNGQAAQLPIRSTDGTNWTFVTNNIMVGDARANLTAGTGTNVSGGSFLVFGGKLWDFYSVGEGACPGESGSLGIYSAHTGNPASGIWTPDNVLIAGGSSDYAQPSVIQFGTNFILFADNITSGGIDAWYMPTPVPLPGTSSNWLHIGTIITPLPEERLAAGYDRPQAIVLPNNNGVLMVVDNQAVQAGFDNTTPQYGPLFYWAADPLSGQWVCLGHRLQTVSECGLDTSIGAFSIFNALNGYVGVLGAAPSYAAGQAIIEGFVQPFSDRPTTAATLGLSFDQSASGDLLGGLPAIIHSRTEVFTNGLVVSAEPNPVTLTSSPIGLNVTNKEGINQGGLLNSITGARNNFNGSTVFANQVTVFGVTTFSNNATMKSGQFNGNGAGLTNLPTSAITGRSYVQTNFVLNTVYAATNGPFTTVAGTAILTAAAAVGNVELDVMYQAGGSGAYAAISAPNVTTTVLSIVMPYQVPFSATFTNGNYYLTNSTTTVGGSASLKSGTGTRTTF